MTSTAMNYARAVTGNQSAPLFAPRQIRVALADSNGVVIHCTVNDVESNRALRLLDAHRNPPDTTVLLRECTHAHRGHCVFGAQCRFVHFRNGAAPLLGHNSTASIPLPPDGDADAPQRAVAEPAAQHRTDERPQQDRPSHEGQQLPPQLPQAAPAAPVPTVTAAQTWSGHLLWPLQGPRPGSLPPHVAGPTITINDTRPQPFPEHRAPPSPQLAPPARSATPTMISNWRDEMVNSFMPHRINPDPPRPATLVEPFPSFPPRFQTPAVPMYGFRPALHDVAAAALMRYRQYRQVDYATGPRHHIPPAVANLQSGGRIDCSLCCETFLNGNIFVCTERHAMCSECLSSYIIENWGNANPREQTSSELRCAHPGCSSAALSIGDVIRHASPSAAEFYVRHRMRLREAECFAEAQQLVAAKLPLATDVLDSLLQRQLQAHLVKAKQCPDCGFGPVDFHGCDDLTYHHMEERDGGAHVDNSCPRCGFFALHVNEWHTWDGTFHALKEPVAGATQRPSRGRGRGAAAAAADARRGVRLGRGSGLHGPPLFGDLRSLHAVADDDGDSAAEETQWLDDSFAPVRWLLRSTDLGYVPPAPHNRPLHLRDPDPSGRHARGGARQQGRQAQLPLETEVTRAVREMFPNYEGHRILALVRQRLLFYRQRGIPPMRDAVIGEVVDELVSAADDEEEEFVDDDPSW